MNYSSFRSGFSAKAGKFLHDPKHNLTLLRAEGRFILGSNSAGQSLIFDRAVESEEALLLPPAARSKSSEGKEVTDLAWYPKDHGIFAILNGPSGKCSIWDTEAFSEVLTVNLRFASFCFAFAREGNELAVGCKDSVRFVDLKSQTAVSTYNCAGQGIVQCIEWSETKPHDAFYGTSNGFIGKFDMRYLGAPAEKFETQQTGVGIEEVWLMNRELLTLNSLKRISHWSLVTGECIQDNAVQFDFPSAPSRIRSHSAVKYRDNAQLLHVGRGFSIWKNEESSLYDSNEQNFDQKNVSYFNRRVNFAFAPLENNEFIHPTLQCTFPFIEYNRQLDEVYLYRPARIAPIFEWEPYSINNSKEKQ